MIVLDTNVVSELMRHSPAPHVMAWLDEQPPGDVFLTSVTLAELLYGVGRLAESRRKTAITARIGELVDTEFRGRMLAFTGDAAARYAEIVVARERLGRPIRMADAQIAAICRHHDATLATRWVKDYANSGVRVVDPWA